jgi:hypothetical protein
MNIETLQKAKNEEFELKRKVAQLKEQNVVPRWLECADGTFYIGSTNDLEKRLHQHNNLKSGAITYPLLRPLQRQPRTW